MVVRLKTVLVAGDSIGPSGHGRSGGSLAALAQVANRPIVDHALDGVREVSQAGIIIAGEAGALGEIRAGLHGEPGRNLDYAICPYGSDYASVLSTVAQLVGNLPCLITPADGLLDEPVSALLDGLAGQPFDLAVIVTSEVADLAMAARVGVRRLRAVAGGTRRTADLALFGPGALARWGAQVRASASQGLLAIAQRLEQCGGRVLFHRVDGWHRYSGCRQDLLELNRIALDRLSAKPSAAARGGNHLEGRLGIDPTATISDSLVIGPSVIGPGATVSNAYIGPYTSIGAGARIEGAEIERSIVSPGASIMHVGGRVVWSLVGRNARVFRDFSLPLALRLWVGEGDEVALC